MDTGLKQFVAVLKEALLGAVPLIASDIDQSVLESDKQVRGIGYLLLATLLGGFLAWAFFAPLESAAVGSGTVQVEGNRKQVQHYEGGIVSEIYVASGDYVEMGQSLIQLDPTQAQAEQNIIEGRVWAKRALVDRLMSERDGADTVVFQQELLTQTDARARGAIESELALFRARRADRLGEIAVLNQRIVQLERRVAGTSAVLDTKQEIVASLNLERAELAGLLNEGYVDKQRIRQLDRTLAQTLGEIAELEAQVASAWVAIEETQLNILQLEKRFKTQVVNALTASSEELYDMQQRLKAINDRLGRTLVTAPIAGYVLGLKPNVTGAVIAPGEELMEIVPDVGKLIIDAKISPMDMDRIRIGQEAEVSFAVFKDAYKISGSLIKVSADSLTDSSTGESYFEAKIELWEEDLALLGAYELVPGMPASVLVKTGSRTFAGYLTSPLHRMFERSLIED